MSIFRVQKGKNNPYVIINKDFLDNEFLSFKAKGILTYLLSKPNNWKVYQSQIEKVGIDGRSSIYSGIEELINGGYVKKSTERADNGKFVGVNYDVFEDNKENKQEVRVDDEKPLTENPHADNQQLLINDLVLKDNNYNKPDQIKDFLKTKTYQYPEWVLRHDVIKTDDGLIIETSNKQIEKYIDKLQNDTGLLIHIKGGQDKILYRHLEQENRKMNDTGMLIHIKAEEGK